MFKIILINIYIFMCFFPALALSKTYYLRANGSADHKEKAVGAVFGPPCADATATMNMATHNSETFSAGDIIKVCGDGGNFNNWSTPFIPPSSGTVDSYITYEAENGHTPVFNGGTHGVDMSKGQDALKFKGLRFQATEAEWFLLDGNHYIWLDQCTFYDADDYEGIRLSNNINYLRITKNIFENVPAGVGTKPRDTCYNWDDTCVAEYQNGDDYSPHCNCSTAPSDMIGSYATGKYWVIEGNYFGNSGHYSIGMYAKNGPTYTVVRGNVFENTIHGNEAMVNYYGGDGVRAYQLKEHNIVVGGGSNRRKNPAIGRYKKGAHAIGIKGSGLIVRNNIVHASQSGVSLSVSNVGYTDENRIYNNSFYNNFHSLYFAGNSYRSYDNNIFKNNMIFTDSSMPSNLESVMGGVGTWPQLMIWSNANVFPSINYFYNNSWTPDEWFYYWDADYHQYTLSSVTTKYPERFKDNISATPYFAKHKLGTTISFFDTNPDKIKDSANGFGDFRTGDQIVVMGSASNDGIYTISSATTSTIILVQTDSLITEAAGRTISVVDAHLKLDPSSTSFIDRGSWLTTILSQTASGQTRIEVKDASYFFDGWGIPGEQGDIIKTESGKSTRISAIDYSMNIITVKPPIDIVSGESISLGFNGTSPDIGASEFNYISLPKDFR